MVGNGNKSISISTYNVYCLITCIPSKDVGFWHGSLNFQIYSQQPPPLSFTDIGPTTTTSINNRT